MIERERYYETYDGDVVGPMEWSPHRGGFWYCDNTRRPELRVETYTKDGHVNRGVRSVEDIAREWRPAP